jgi:hypothetical protein
METTLPYSLKNALPILKLQAVNEHIHRHWYFGNGSTTGDGTKFWGGNDRNDIVLFDAACYLKYKLQKVLKKSLRPVMAHVNGQTKGQEGGFHTDHSLDNVWSFVLFTSYHWNTKWGGEFCCLCPDGNYKYSPYIPNSGVLIPATWHHKGSGPNSLANSELRTSVGFMFCLPEMFSEVIGSVSYQGQFFR